MDGSNRGLRPSEADWVEPQAFSARIGGAGIDHDFGMRWGERREQRISLRLRHGADRGLLYAYDPTWDEYAFLHVHLLAFAELVRRHQLLHAGAARPTTPAAVVHP